MEGKDPILKERLFGLTNSEANHGEDVKEYYFYLDSTPTHSYMKYLYKYPQAAYPYGDLIETNKRRTRNEMEYELLDTGVFNEDRYFDVFVEYAKQSPEDLLIQISVSNRGPEAAAIARPPDPVVSQHLDMVARYAQAYPETDLAAGKARRRLRPRMPIWASAICIARETSRCCSPRTRPTTSASSAPPNAGPYVKDGINNYVVHGNHDAVNPEKTGTKSAAHYQLKVGAGENSHCSSAAQRSGACGHRRSIQELRLTILQTRRSEADEFYKSHHPAPCQRR